MIVATFGGGVNSTAGIIEMVRRGIVPDVIPFSDTGGERPEIYSHLVKFHEWLLARGCPGLVVLYQTYLGERETLEQHCARLKCLPSIAYGWKTCSQKYKTQPIDRMLNDHDGARAIWAAGGKVKKAIFFDAGEERRVKSSTGDKFENWYPLIEWQLYREDCIKICASEGFNPGKSSCFFCPSMTKAEIVELSTSHPDLMARALAMEAAAAPGLVTVKGLGRRLNWADFLNAEKRQCKLIPDTEVETPCGCYD